MRYIVVMNDLTNETFGRWTVIRYAGKQGKHPMWECRCQCGTKKIIHATNLTRHTSQSCGCLNSEITAQRNRDNAIHGQSGNGSRGKFATPEYEAWIAMLKRCDKPSTRGYQHYGGRGIKVCKRWRSFVNFFADMGPRPSPTHSIDRINNDGDYTPRNCRWSTNREQGRNRRTNVLLTMKGVSLTVTEWAERLIIPRHTLFARLRKGWSVEKTLTYKKP